MNWSLQINGKRYNNQNVLTINNSEIRSFLEEWGNKEPSINVQTSGSTGNPKKIQLLKSDMIASAKLTGKYFNLKKGQSALLCLPVKYIAGKMMLIRGIVLGLDLISVPPSSNPLEYCDRNIDFAAMTPMQVKTVLSQSPEKLELINQLIIGGAPVDIFLESKLQDINTLCFSTYGMTETITHIAVKTLNGKHKSEHFEALPNVIFELNDNDCLVINTPHLLTSITTTNDIVLLSDNERFKWLGRIDNVINSGGIKLHPEVLEKKILSLLKGVRFFFSSLPDKTLGEQLIMIIESPKNIPNLEADLSTKLNGYEIPKSIFFLDKFIYTETDKINRKKTVQMITDNSQHSIY